MYNFKYPVIDFQNINLPIEPWTISYSQAGQDLFVIAMLQGKKNGTFLELGSGQPKYGNNTYILENKFNFTGVSIDLYYDEDTCFVMNQQLERNELSWSICRPKTNYYKCDALTFDYDKLLNYFDYLQVDLDSSFNNLQMLEKIIKTKSFAVITFEHDVWNVKDNDSLYVKFESQKILKEQGYELIVDNVTIEPGPGGGIGNQPIFFEDWYANPKFIPTEVIQSYKWLNPEDIKYFSDILYKKVY